MGVVSLLAAETISEPDLPVPPESLLGSGLTGIEWAAIAAGFAALVALIAHFRDHRQQRRSARYDELAALYGAVGATLVGEVFTILRVHQEGEIPVEAALERLEYLNIAKGRLVMHGAQREVISAVEGMSQELREFDGQLEEAPLVGISDFYSAARQHLDNIWTPPDRWWRSRRKLTRRGRSRGR